MKADTPVTIIIPTWNNQEYLHPCLTGLLHNRATPGLYRVIVVNNGHEHSCDWIQDPLFTVINAGDNLGWEGGLKLGLQHTTSEFICFLNDDIHIPPISRFWLNRMLQHFNDPKVAAVGPSSNVVMGFQNIFTQTPATLFNVKFLIGFCFLVRRAALEEVGGIDDTLPGGDDFDMSIRLRKAGYKLVVDKNTFVFHHGFKTGTRVHGDHNRPNGWNSYEFKEKTDHALIRKHGFSQWWDCTTGAWSYPPQDVQYNYGTEDIEGDVVRENIKAGVVLDLGCGARKTVPEAIGVDMIPKDAVIDSLSVTSVSQADVVGDISEPLPFNDEYADTIIARHVLEHVIDPIGTIKNWIKVLKTGGRLIIAVPDETKIFSIPMNIEHRHAWNPQAMKTMLELLGLKVAAQVDPNNHISFVTIAEKV